MIQKNRAVSWTTEWRKSPKLNRWKKERIKQNEDTLQDLWDNNKHTNIHIIDVPKEEERDKGTENLFGEIIAENFPNLKKETDIQVQETQRRPNKMNPKKPTPRYIIIKMSRVKDKERILKLERGKQQVTHKGNQVRLSADFSVETLQAGREWYNIFKVLKGKRLQPRILYLARLLFRMEGEKKSFPESKN